MQEAELRLLTTLDSLLRIKKGIINKIKLLYKENSIKYYLHSTNILSSTLK